VTAYVDHAATTPMVPAALAAVVAALHETGNAASLHASGRRARRLVEESREQLAGALGARPSEVVFTAGGTESDNLAVKGIFWARRAQDPRRVRILASAVEHHAVLDAVLWLVAAQGAAVTWLPVDTAGRVHPEVLAAALLADGGPATVALVTVMWANNEVGTVQPVQALAEVAHEHGVPLHTDAVQAVGQLPVSFSACGADALTIAAHKYGGPPGAGALLTRRGLALAPLLHGGGQERDVRSGTLDVPALAGMAVATEIAVADQPARAVRLSALRAALLAGVRAAVPDVVLGGDPDRAGSRTVGDGPPGLAGLPGLAHLRFPGCEGDALLMLLDARGVECSTGSACSAGVARPSHVLTAMGASEDEARSALRFSLGWTSTAADVEAVVAAVRPAAERARAARAVLARR